MTTNITPSGGTCGNKKYNYKILLMEKSIVITKSDIISAVGFWGIRQSPYTFPENLSVALTALEKRIDEKGVFKGNIKKQISSYLEITIEDFKVLLHDLVFNTPEIAAWNLTKYEIDKGITNPFADDRPIKFGISSIDTYTKCDYDFIDLDALLQNVTQTILDYDK